MQNPKITNRIQSPKLVPKRDLAPAGPGKKRTALYAGVAAVVLAVGAGGGWYFYTHNSNPMKRAEELAAKGDLRGAQLEFRNAVRDNPNSADAHLRLAQTQMQLSDPVAAEKEFKAARDLGGDRWAIIPQLGSVYMAQSRYQDVLTEVPPEGPKPPEAPRPDIAAKNLMLRSMAQVGMNDVSGAVASLALAEKLAPENVEVLLTSARLALALRDYPLAEKKADEALKLDPKQIEGLLMKGQILAAKGDTEGALKFSDQAVALDPNSTAARLDRANRLMIAGQDAKSQADVAAVLALQPRNAGATYLNGVLMVRAGKYADAQLELQKLGPVISRFPRALYFQALAAANLGQVEASIDLANRYVARAPNDADGVRLVARAELSAQRPERAVAVLTKAIAGGQNDGQTLDLLGRSYSLLGRNPEAIETFKKASALSPNDPLILTHLASSEMQSGDPGKAAAALEKSIEIAPNQPNSGEALVAAALAAGDMDRADQALNRLRAQVGETEAVGILTGMLKLGRLDLDGGRAAFAATLKLFPDSLNAKLNLAKVLILQNRRAEGDALLREILAKDPTFLPALNTSVQLQVQDGQFPQAIQALEAARAAAPKNLAFTSMISDVIVRSGDPRRAVAMLQAMRSNEELPPVLLAALARAQVAAGLTDDARNTYRDVLKVTPGDLDIRRAQVDLLLRNKDVDGAMASLREALALAPGNIGLMSTMVNLETQTKGVDAALRLAEQLRNTPSNLPNSTVLKGDILMLAQRTAEAVEAYRLEYKTNPTTPLLLRLANALSVNGKDDEAATYLREGLARTPDEPDTAQMLGLLDVKAKRWDDAAKNLTTVLSKRPNDPVAMNNLAWVYQVKGDSRARNLAQRAYLQAPTPETGDTLGWIMVKQGDAKTALPLLQQATAQRPGDPTIKYHVAVAMNDSGRKEDAIKLLQPLVNGPEAFDDKGEARKLLEVLSPTPVSGAAPRR